MNTQAKSGGGPAIVTVTGSTGKTTTAHLLAHLLDAACEECSPPPSAAIVEFEPELLGDMRIRIPADVAIVTNVQNEAYDPMLRFVSESTSATSVLVFNADDAPAQRFAAQIAFAGTPVLCSRQPKRSSITNFVAAGGTAFVYENGWIVEKTRMLESLIVPAASLPVTMKGAAAFQVANSMTAIAAARALGVSRRAVAHAAKSFRVGNADEVQPPLYKLGKGHVLLDPGRTPHGVAAVAETAAAWSTRRTAVINASSCSPGSELDHLAKIVALGFDRTYVCGGGRTATSLASGVGGARVVLEEATAVRLAAAEMQAGETIVVFYEDQARVRELLSRLGARPVGGPELSS